VAGKAVSSKQQVASSQLDTSGVAGKAVSSKQQVASSQLDTSGVAGKPPRSPSAGTASAPLSRVATSRLPDAAASDQGLRARSSSGGGTFLESIFRDCEGRRRAAAAHGGSAWR